MIVKRIDASKRSVTLIPESTLDLLNIFRLVSVGDVAYSETTREVKKERADGRFDSERVPVTLGVRVEKKIVDPLIRRIGFSGRIVYESRQLDLIGKHHTIHVHVGMEIRIDSEGNFVRLRSFSSNYLGKKARRVLCVTVDDEKVAVSEFTNMGLKTLYSRAMSAGGKLMNSHAEDAKTKIFAEVAELLESKAAENKDLEIVVLGSSISIDVFLEFLRKEAKKIHDKIRRTGYVSTGGEEGLREALRSGGMKDYAEDLKPVRDSLEVEEFIKRMSENPEKVAVGLSEVLEAVKLKAVEKILVSERFLWDRIVEEEVSLLLDEAEQGRLDLRVILDGLEASEKISALGGIVATLYYPVRFG